MKDRWSTSNSDEEYEENQAYRLSVFDRIRPEGDWKMLISADIPMAVFEECNRACIWFTGSVLSIDAGPDQDGYVQVSAPGYYETVGS